MSKMIQALALAIIISLTSTACVSFRICGGDMPETDSETYLKWCNEPYDLIKKVRGREKLTPEEYKRLSESFSHDVKRMIASNPYTPPEILKELADSWFWYVRRGVAGNQAASDVLLEKLAEDSNEYVRWSLAANSSIKSELIQKCFQRNDRYIDQGLASNPSVPSETLIRLYDRYKNDYFINYISYDFACNPKLPPEIARHIFESEKDKNFSMPLDRLAMNPSVPPDLLLAIYRLNNPTIRINLFENNPNCPEEIKQVIQARREAFAAKQQPCKRKLQQE